MKAAITILIMLIVALIFPASSSGCQNEISHSSLSDDQNPRLSIMSVDTKRLEERMTGALADMISQSQSANEEKEGYGGSLNSSSKGLYPLDAGSSDIDPSAIDLSSINSSAANTSINSSAANTSINSSAANLSTADASVNNPSAPESPIPAQGGSAGEQGIGSSTNSKFNGYYGITSSQHQMGKNSVDSSTFLSGSFSMEKAVKFQDRGI